jgi:TDG/mug DNA glycosylase family protein
MTDAQRRSLIARGLGITNIVHRATAKASELTTEEFRAGGDQLRTFVRVHRPVVVAVAGITAYRAAFSCPKATMGEQPERLEGALLFVVPNPSGLNAHETTASLAASYREAASAAGVLR